LRAGAGWRAVQRKAPEQDLGRRSIAREDERESRFTWAGENKGPARGTGSEASFLPAPSAVVSGPGDGSSGETGLGGAADKMEEKVRSTEAEPKERTLAAEVSSLAAYGYRSRGRGGIALLSPRAW